MSTPIQIVSNCVHARVMNAPHEVLMQLSELLSYEVAGADHGAGGWSGRSTLFGWEKSSFPAGFLTLVYSELKKGGHQVQLLRKPAPEPLGPENPIVNTFGRTEEYQYQYDTVDRLVRHRAMIARIATGGGKSNIANIAFARIGRPTLFITTRSILMYQMKAAFEEAIDFQDLRHNGRRVRCGVLGDGEWSPSSHLNVAMVQTLAARLKDPASEAQIRELLKQVELVILEEAHEASGESYFQILNACVNAHYRLALTATPFMRDDEEANMRLMAVSGPIGIEVSEKDLIDKGILAKPIFKYHESPMPSQVRRSSNWQRAYHYGVVENHARNALVCAEAHRAAAAGISVMVLVQRKEHGKILREELLGMGIRCQYIFGESDQDRRKAALNALKTGETQVLIGSTILDVGVDVPAVGMVILAGAGKAEVALRQRIGRGLRRKPKGMPNIAFVVDFYDPISKHLVGHSKQRRAIVEATPGFAENILPKRKDFDFTPFGVANRPLAEFLPVKTAA